MRHENESFSDFHACEVLDKFIYQEELKYTFEIQIQILIPFKSFPDLFSNYFF